jgi:hypothetical protein
MSSRGTALLAALLLAGCAARAPSPDRFAFAVMGDTPYNDREEAHFLRMMQRVDAEPVAFVVHVGDFKAGGGSACTDALFEKRKAQFDASRHPFIYTPGDNDWTDCRRPSNGATDPIERLARLRQVFFTDAWSLGRERIATAFQGECIEFHGASCTCPAHPENRQWTRSGVRFVTLNIPGSDNNVGFDRANDEEARCRNEANRRWLERAVTESAGDDTRALVVFIQADPWATKKPVYKGFLAQLQDATLRLRKAVLFVHGDTHTYQFDAPFLDATGQPIPNLMRLEVYGSPIVGWVKVTVDAAFPELFAVEPRSEAIVP